MSSRTPPSKDLSPYEKRELLKRLLKEKAANSSDHRQSASQSPIQPQSREREYFPLSSAQQRLLFLDQFEPNTPIYNIPAAYRLRGPLNVSALERSLNEIVQRHESLRTNIAMQNGRGYQKISPTATLSLQILNLEAMPKDKLEIEAMRLANEEATLPFNLAQALKLRVTLIRLSLEEHLLIMTMHHISTDGWSMGVFLRELALLYEALVTGKPSPLPNLAIQYVDYACWHEQWLQSEALETQLNYWKKQLDNPPALIELPTDRPRPAIQTYHGDWHHLTFPPELSTALKSLSREEGVTLFMTLMAGFQTLLFRYTGQEDIIVGSPIAGRTHPEIRDLIGFFINTMMLRADLSNNPTFRELLGQVRQAALGAYENQDVPFEKLVEELQPVRNLSYSSLFQVMFILQSAPIPGLKLYNLTSTPMVEVNPKTSKFDLSLSLTDTDQGLTGALEYNTDLFDQTTIGRMAGQFETLLMSAATTPDQHITELSILTEAERQQILVDWNETGMKVEPSPTHLLFETQASKTPESVAVAFEGQSLTYHELNERANQLAHYLRRLGVKADTLVGIYMERSLEMIVGLLGILKAGGAYLPLDPAFPIERLAFMLSDSQAPVLLTQQKLADQIEVEKETKIVCIDNDWERIGMESSENPNSVVQQENLAYVIYTSGSTGRPKGVQIQHGSVVNFLHSMQREPGLSDQDVLFSVTTISFDISVLEIFLPLITGARLELAGREVAADGMQLMTQLDRSGATVMQATPTTWRMLIESGWRGNDRLKILCGGEALSRDLASQIQSRCASLWNMYGPTETTIWSTICQVQPGASDISIGRPIGNTQCYILDSHLQPVPIGVPGELYIGGDGLARGYLNRTELTTERFIPDLFSVKPQAKLYKTGDLVRYTREGYIHYLGRTDTQIKIRGFRVELSEIETVLIQHPAVREAVVTVREDAPNDKRLVGYLVLKENFEEPPANELRNFAREKLPIYMIPNTFVFLAAYPLTPNKKIDRKALPVPDQTRPELNHQYAAPRDEIEEGIATIMATLLKLEKVGINDNFFDLGGHSLLATQVMSRIRQELNVDLPLRTLFEASTPEELGLVIMQRKVEQVDTDKLTELLAGVENLSMEEVKALLDADQ